MRNGLSLLFSSKKLQIFKHCVFSKQSYQNQRRLEELSERLLHWTDVKIVCGNQMPWSVDQVVLFLSVCFWAYVFKEKNLETSRMLNCVGLGLSFPELLWPPPPKPKHNWGLHNWASSSPHQRPGESLRRSPPCRSPSTYVRASAFDGGDSSSSCTPRSLTVAPSRVRGQLANERPTYGLEIRRTLRALSHSLLGRHLSKV